METLKHKLNFTVYVKSLYLLINIFRYLAPGMNYLLITQTTATFKRCLKTYLFTKSIHIYIMQLLPPTDFQRH